MKRFFLVLFLMTLCSNSWSQVVDYTKLLEVDLEEKIPSLEELKEKYSKKKNGYDYGYDFHWNIGNVFSQAFKATITSYGGSDKRVIHEDEKTLLKILESLSEDQYQYIGPYLHTLPNMPDKILNMPGIKETKNKFPTRIAKELEDLEDLEFLSPYMYFLLMPEMWPSSYQGIQEKPRGKKSVARRKYDPDFFNNLKKLVPEENYVPGVVVKDELKSGLRTMKPSKTGSLTRADVRAFASTISEVEAWGDEDYRVLKISDAGDFLDAWEIDNGKGIPMQSIKDVVNPCQRLVQKVRLAGLEYEFLAIVGKQGFDLNGWAYTCDKTIKAHRVSTINSGMVNVVMNYQRAIYEKETQLLDEEAAQQQYLVMQALAEMYKSSMNDVMEVRKERKDIHEEILKLNDSLINSPIVM